MSPPTHLLECALLDEVAARNEEFGDGGAWQTLLYRQHLHEVVLLLDVVVDVTRYLTDLTRRLCRHNDTLTWHVISVDTDTVTHWPDTSPLSTQTQWHNDLTRHLCQVLTVCFCLGLTTVRRQCIQNTTGRLMKRLRTHKHITPGLKHLHWLPIQERITLKVLFITIKAHHSLAIRCISKLLIKYSHAPSIQMQLIS